MTPAHLPARRALAVPLLALGLATLAGCATVGERNPRDPFEPFNRSMYEVNEGIDRVALKPVATFYKEKVPAPVRTGVSNFFGNLGDAWSAVNALLQFHLRDAEENLARFHLNTMFGVFGIFDIASDLNIERHREDFGQTLGRWGVPSGPFVMLPFFGPSTVRDTLALPVDKHYQLIGEIEPVTTRNATYALEVIDKRSNLLRVGSVLEQAALDKYSFTRDAYLQRRRMEVNGGREEDDGEVPPALPDESLDAPQAPASAPPASGQDKPAR